MKKTQIVGLLCLLVAVLFFHMLFGCSITEGFAATTSSSTVAYVPSPATFGQFMTDIQNGNVTNGGQWLYTPQPGTQPYTPIQQQKPCQQAYSNQSLYTASTPWSTVVADANKTQ